MSKVAVNDTLTFWMNSRLKMIETTYCNKIIENHATEFSQVHKLVLKLSEHVPKHQFHLT